MSDETLRRVLTRIEESYVEPGRIAPRRMLAKALGPFGGAAEEDLADAHGSAGGLAGRPAPALERALDRGAPDQREQRRAILLSGALRALDRYSRAVSGSARLRLLDRYTGSTCGIGVRIGCREGESPRSAHCSRAVLRRSPESPLVTICLPSTAGVWRARRVIDVLRALRGPRGTSVTLGLAIGLPVDLIVTSETVREVESRGVAVGGDGVARLRHPATEQARTPLGRSTAGSPRSARPAALAGWFSTFVGIRAVEQLAAAAIADRFVGKRNTGGSAGSHAGKPVAGLTTKVEASERESEPGWPVAWWRNEFGGVRSRDGAGLERIARSSSDSAASARDGDEALPLSTGTT